MEILGALEILYSKSASLKAAWPAEKSALGQIVVSLEAELAGQFELGAPLGVGGSGVVLRVRDMRLGVARAIKFSRPSPGKEELLAGFLASESARLVELSHPYLMRVHAKGTVLAHDQQVPYYVMDLYDDVSDADEYVNLDTVSGEDILVLVERILEAVTYMHSQGEVHLDIKPGNILVRPGNIPVLSDLGFAKILRDDSGVTIIGGTEGFIHPEARRFIVEASSDPNRLKGETVRSLLKPTWDLFALGKTLLILLKIVDERTDRPLTLYAHRYLKLLACRLLDGQNSMNETLLGLSRSAFEEIKYAQAAHALLDVRKLSGGYNLETRIPELDQFGATTIQASTFATTPLTPRVEAILAHEDLARLGGFTQLSLLNLVYPTATHTRLEHAIGTFSAMCRYITALFYDPINPLFRQIMTEEDLLSALLVALVHDIGHFGLAHDLEDADLEIFSHETRGRELLRDSKTGLRGLIERSQLENGEPGWGVSIERLLSILESDVRADKGSLKDRLIHSMIDGPIDADKLDYIIRDSNNLGLTYGSVIDVERLLRVLTVVSRQVGADTHVGIAIHERGRVTAEAVAFARYALYGSVYWHHAYRSIKAMLQRIALEYLEKVDQADKSRKTGIRKSVVEQLYPALWPHGGAPQSLPLSVIAGSSQIHPGDKAVLEWISDRSGDTGRDLAHQIEDRKLFKRVFVISRWGNESLWREVTDLTSQLDWRRKLKFQRAFQTRLTAAVEQLHELAPQTAMVIADARNEFIAAGKSTKAIVLVDATQPKPGATSNLELVQEEDRRRALQDELTAGRPEQSHLWDALRDDLHESLGKVRIVCDPNHARFVSALNREVVEAALEQALRDA